MAAKKNKQEFCSPWSKDYKTGRPPKAIDWKKFTKLCTEQCTKVDICLEFGIDPATLDNKIRDKFNMTFSVLFEILRTKGIRSLRSLNFKLAMAGDRTMAKHVLGLYAHKDPNINPQIYGDNPLYSGPKDAKVDVNVSFKTVSDSEKNKAEVAEISKMKNDD